jgi:hypothetical protein
MSKTGSRKKKGQSDQARKALPLAVICLRAALVGKLKQNHSRTVWGDQDADTIHGGREIRRGHDAEGARSYGELCRAL